MTEWFETLPMLWQTVLGGITVILLWEITKLLFKIFSKQASLSRSSRQNKIDRLKQFINSDSPAERTEGSVEFIFTILRYLFIGNLLWALPEVFSPIFGIWVLGFLKLFGVGYFAVGLRWILVYLKLKSSNNANPADAPKER